MLWLLCLTGPFQGLLDGLEEAGRRHEDCQMCLGKWQEQAWDYDSSKAAWLAVILSPENQIQSHQPHAGSVVNLCKDVFVATACVIFTSCSNHS